VGYSSGDALTESWDGTKWAIEIAPTPSGGTSIGLTGLSCTLPSVCTAVGSYNDLSTGHLLSLVEQYS